MIDVGSAVGYLMLDTTGFKSGFRSAMQDMKTFESDSATRLDKISAMGSALSSVGESLTKHVTLPLVGMGTAITAVTTNFESSMSKVAAISGIDTLSSDFEELSEKAKEMGASTKFSASEAADAFTYMAMAGWKTESMLSGIEGIMDLAAASGENLALTSDIVTDALTAFGLQAEDSSHFADVLAAASNNANTNVSMLGESFKYIAPVAGSLGYSVEDVSIALGLMANSGIKAGQAGTALRAALANMVKPTDEMEAVMDRYNISLTDSSGNMKSLMEVVVDLREKMGGLDQATQASAASALFGKEAMSGMLAIINASDEDFEKLAQSIYNADGTAKKMANTMQDNLQGKLTILKSALEGLAISIGQIIIPILTKGVEGLTKMVDGLNSMSDGTKKVIVVISTILALLGPLLLIIGKFSMSISSIINLIGGAGGLSAILSALTGPLGLVIGAVAALTTAWVTNFGNIRGYTSEIFEAISSVFSTFLEFITNLWDENFLGIQDIVQVWAETIELVFQTLFDNISNIFQIFAAIFHGDWDEAWRLVKETFFQTLDTIKTFFSNSLNIIVDTLIRIGVNLYHAAKESFHKILEGFKEIWKKVTSWFSEAVQDPIGTIMSIGDRLYEAGASIFSSLWEGMKSIWHNITSWVSDSIDWLASKVKFWESESAKISSPKDSRSTQSKSRSGSYASGLDYVPRDMDVRVHEGEAIITKQENKNRDRNNSRGDTFNFYSPEAIDPIIAAREVKRVKQELAEGVL